MLGYLLRGASFLVAFALSAAGIWRLSDLALTRLGVERGNTSLDFTEVLEGWYPKIAEMTAAMTAESGEEGGDGDGDEEPDADE